MLGGITDAATRLRRPEHTGENRCTPCTILNVLIAAIISVSLGYALGDPIGALAFGICAAVIYLRGYLVPGTPTITRAYFPAWVLRRFGKTPSDVRQTFADEAGARGELIVAGIVRINGTPRVTPDFWEEWRETMREVRTSDLDAEDVTAALGADAERKGELSYVVDGTSLVRWESEAALVADVAASRELDSRLDAWSAFDAGKRRDALTRLRLLVPRCPRCDGEVAATEERVEPCCQKPFAVLEASCRECGSVIARAEVIDPGEESALSEYFRE